MENSKDTTMTEKTLNDNASTDLEFIKKEEGGQMNRGSNVNEELAISPLRKGRYLFMKDHLQSKGGYILEKHNSRALNHFEGWTREQIEQALDDVILCGYGEVYSYQQNGGIVIKFIDKEKKLQGSATS